MTVVYAMWASVLATILAVAIWFVKCDMRGK
jgi:hypothetical protein